MKVLKDELHENIRTGPKCSYCILAVERILLWTYTVKVPYHPVHGMNTFVTNKSKLSLDGAQLLPYMGWLAIMWPSHESHESPHMGHMIANHSTYGNNCAPSCGNFDLFVTNLFIPYKWWYVTFNCPAKPRCSNSVLLVLQWMYNALQFTANEKKTKGTVAVHFASKQLNYCTRCFCGAESLTTPHCNGISENFTE